MKRAFVVAAIGLSGVLAAAPGSPVGSATVKHLPTGRRGGFWEAYKSEIAA